MSDEVEKFVSTIVDAGLSLRSPDFSTEIALDSDCSNVTAGILRGLGPRYGMSPLVSQSTLESVGTTRDTYGYLGSVNTTSTRPIHGLYRIYGIVPLSLIDQTQIGTSFQTAPLYKQYFISVLGLNLAPATTRFSEIIAFSPFGTSSSTSPDYVWTMKAAVAYGLVRPLMVYDALPGALSQYPNIQRLPARGSSAYSTEEQNRSYYTISQQSGTLDYASVAVLSVAGANIPAKWLVGTKIANSTVANSATANFTALGVPNFVIDRKFQQNTSRTYSLYNVTNANGLELEYVYRVNPTPTELVAAADYDTTTAHLTGTWVNGATATVARLDGAAAVQPNYVVWKDPSNYLNTEHALIFVATGQPRAVLIQSWNRNNAKDLIQYLDLRNSAVKPRVQITTIPGGATRYLENSVGAGGGTPVATCWSNWPTFVKGTALQTDAAAARNGQIHVTLGAANSGILRANTVYEFAFSIYDKSLGIESNVGQPAKIQTAAADFVGLTLFRDQVTAGNYNQLIARGTTAENYVPINYDLFANTNSSLQFINYMEIRVYYRPLGSFEWLPGLFIDAVEYFYNPNLKELYACSGAVAGSVGGQPGGFNDYSELPDDAWNCVVVWKQRVFWLSEKSLVFSLVNNGFSYPIRNAFPVPQGQYRGAIIHNYPGQAEQDSRLIVFGTREIYVGKFTGVRQQQWVQVSADDGGVFDIDGSDFVLNSWTSITAFSYRSACVADGILYYWGPQGVYRDDGRDTPTKISDDIEPTIFDLYAKQRTNDIHCTYSEQTKEIIWFYFDNSVYSTYSATEAQTKLLIYNTQTEQFFFGATSACIDGSQKLASGSGTMDLVRKTGGDRTIVFPRVSKASTGVQQAYFFDYRNRAGDLRYGLERMVNVIATPSTGSRRLTLPNGATGIAVGDYISTDQIQAYTNNQDSSGTAITVEDFVGKVTAVNTSGTHYIDVLLPTDLSSFQGAATLDALTAFPIYVNKTILAADATAGNAFPYSLETTFWCPQGLMANWFWLYVHMLFKVELLKAEGLGISPGFDFSYLVPTASDWQTQAIIFGREVNGVWDSTLNTYGDHQQTYHPFEEELEGQGIKLRLAGLHYAHKWVLQYLAAYANPQTFDFLKQFEG